MGEMSLSHLVLTRSPLLSYRVSQHFKCFLTFHLGLEKCESRKMFLIVVKYRQHEIYHFNHLEGIYLSDIQYLHTVLQSPQSCFISRTLSSSKTETVYPLNTNFPFPPSPSLGKPPDCFLSL